MTAKRQHKLAPTPEENLTKSPPHNLEAEESVLGAVMLDPGCLVRIRDFLQPRDFYREDHRKVYEAFLEIVADGNFPDVVTTSAKIRDYGWTLGADGLSSAFLAELSNRVPSAANVEAYARIVREKSILRDVIAQATAIAGDAYEPQPSVEAFLDLTEKYMLEVTRARINRGAFTAAESIAAVRERYHRPERIMIPTGIRSLDDQIGGLGRGREYAIGGRTGEGKTVLALNITTRMARAGYGAIYHTLEMPRTELMLREVANQLGIENQDLQNGDITPRERELVEEELAKLAPLPLYIREEHGPWQRHLATYEALCSAHPEIAIVVVDHLNLLQEGFDPRQNRYQQLGTFTKAMKTFAKEWNVVVLIIAQLKRPDGKQANRPPSNADFKESGCVEEDADGTFLISVPAEAGDQEMDIRIGKMRGGRKSSVKLYYDERYQRVGDWETRWDQREVGRLL